MCVLIDVYISGRPRPTAITVLGGALDNCLWFLLPEEFFADLMNIRVIYTSQGARFLKIDLAQLSSQKRFDFRNS